MLLELFNQPLNYSILSVDNMQKIPDALLKGLKIIVQDYRLASSYTDCVMLKCGEGLSWKSGRRNANAVLW